MSHSLPIWSDLIRDLINLEGNGSLDLNIVLSNLLVFKMVYLLKYFCDFIQLFQNNISVFLKVLQWQSSNWLLLEKQIYYFETIV